jgi:hypothetical protein
MDTITLSNGLRGVDVELGNKGVLISATQEITVFGVNKEQYSTDGFVAFPTDTLGTEYVLITWFTATFLAPEKTFTGWLDTSLVPVKSPVL